MNLLKKIINLKLYKNYISFFAIFFLVNNLIAFGSENKSQSILSKQRNVELDEIFKLNEITYSEYDNFNNHHFCIECIETRNLKIEGSIETFFFLLPN